jgi:hypothetical protein
MSTISTPSSATATGQRRRDRAATVLAAVAAAVLAWIVAGPFAGADLTVQQGDRDPMDIGIAPVVLTALIAGLAAWGSLALLEHLTARAATIWTAIAAIALGLSLLAPLTAEAATGTRVSLVLLHLIVGGVLIAGLRRTTA